MIDGVGWAIEKSDLVIHDAHEGALKRFQENVLNPALNSAVVEPYNTVAAITNSVSGGRKLLPHKEDFETGECKFLSSKWLVQNAAGGLAMLLPYSLAGKGAGKVLTHFGTELNVGERTAKILENEVTAQIMGAAVYDGLRETKEGETHIGNAIGGVTAFSAFAIGHSLSKDLPLTKMLTYRTLAGAIGGSAQHVASEYWSNNKLPSLEDVGKSTVNGMVMSMVLPESQRVLKAAVETGHETFNPGVPVDRFVEVRAPSAPAAHATLSELPAEHAPATYDFFIKSDSQNNSSKPERGKDDRQEGIKAQSASAVGSLRGFELSTNSNQAVSEVAAMNPLNLSSQAPNSS